MPPQTRKRELAAEAAAGAAERSQGTRKRPKRKQTGINLAVSEPPQASKGNRFVDFEAILKHSNVLNDPEEAKPETKATDAGRANKTIFKSVLDNDDIEVVRCGDLSVHIYQHVHRTLKSRHIKDWCAQSWSMVVQFGTPQVYFFKRNLRRYRKGQLDL